MTTKQKKLLAFILTFVGPPVLAALAAWVLLKWHIQTRVGFEVTTRQVRFTVGRSGQDKAVLILDPTSFQSLAAENFSGIQFTPEEISVADPKQYNPADDSYPPSAWRLLSPHNSWVKIRAVRHDQDPRVTFERAEGQAAEPSRLDELRAGPGSTVEWGTAEDRQLILKVSNNNEQAAVNVALFGTSRIFTDHSALEGVSEQPLSGQSLTYRVRLPDTDPAVQISGRNNSLTIIATLPAGSPPGKLTQLSIPVTTIDLTLPHESTGNVQSALLKGGEISYPDYPQKEKVSFQAEDYLYLSGLENFTIESLAFSPGDKGFTLRADGLAEKFESGPAAFIKDRRLTAFDCFWHSNVWIKVFLVAGWVAGFVVNFWQLRQEFNKGVDA